MKVKKIKNKTDFIAKSMVKVTTCGNVTCVSTTHTPFTFVCDRIDKDHYCYLPTGEIREYSHGTSRASDLQSVARSLALGRDILNANITDVSKCRWLTLTYAENMTDPKRLYRDFQTFNRRCRSAFGRYEYITAAEPQKRGAWHLHCVFIFPEKAPFMKNEIVRNLWGQGHVMIKRLDENVDNIGAYLTAYLGDMELTDDEKADVHPGRIKTVDYIDNDGKMKNKRYVKGGRLKMYPPGFHMFRFSKGIKRPDVKYMYYGNFEQKEKASCGTLTFSEKVEFSDETSGFTTSVSYEYYNKARKKSQDPR